MHTLGTPSFLILVIECKTRSNYSEDSRHVAASTPECPFPLDIHFLIVGWSRTLLSKLLHPNYAHGWDPESVAWLVDGSVIRQREIGGGSEVLLSG